MSIRRISAISATPCCKAASVSGVTGSAPLFASLASWLKLLARRDCPSWPSARPISSRSSLARPRRWRGGGGASASRTREMIYAPSGISPASAKSRSRCSDVSRIENGAGRLRLLTQPPAVRPSCASARQPDGCRAGRSHPYFHWHVQATILRGSASEGHCSSPSKSA